MLSAPAFAGGIPLDNKGKLTMGFKSYINLTSLTEKQNGVNTNEQTGLAIDRFYVNLGYKVNNIWSARFTTDVNNEQNTTDSGGNTSNLNSNFNVNVEYAYLQGKLLPALRIRLGMAPTPWIMYEENLWRHRYVSRVYTELYQLDDLGDLGINLAGRFFDGRLEYSISEVNGGGIDNPSASKSIDFNFRLTYVPVDGLHISGQFRDGYRGTKTTTATTPAKDRLFQALISYGQDNYRLGGNYISNRSNVSSTSIVTKDTGYSLWGWTQFMPEYGFFGRYEFKDHTVTGNGAKGKTDRFLLGLEYLAMQNLRFSLVYDRSKFKNSQTANATLATGDDGSSTRFGLFSEFSF